VETASDHEVEDEEEFFIEYEDDAFADASEGCDGSAFDGFDARYGGSEKERRGDAEVFEWLAYDARFEGCEVSRDVWEFGHRMSRRSLY
jgi:hypothetical protein